MTPEELGRVLALIGAYLPSPVRVRFFALLPESLRTKAMSRVEDVQNLEREHLSVVEQVLLSDLEARFAEGEVTAEIEALPLGVADIFALVLRKAPIGKSADLVKRLPDDLQSEVLHLIAAQSWSVWERRLGAQELQLMVALRDVLDLSDFKAIPDFVAEILHVIQTPADVRRNLTYMYEKDPDSTGYIQNYLYGFESLVKLTDRELQHVLQGVDHWDLILALRSAPANMRRKVLSNLSQRRADLFKDDEATLEEVDDAQVEMVQHQILDRARLLYENGALHTYLGSIAGQEGDIDLTDENENTGRPTGKTFRPKQKKTQKQKYGVGILLLLFLVGIGGGFLYWFQNFGESMPQTGQGKGAFVGEDEELESVSRTTQAGKKRSSTQQLGQAAVISGRALLVTGETVRSVEGQELKPGDRIQTGADGRVGVDLSNDAGQLQIEAETDVQIGEAHDEATGPPRLDLRVGNIWVQVKDPTLEVTSPLAEVTASEGALYHLRISLNATTTLSVHGGTVWVQGLKSGGLHVLGIGERLRIEPDGDVKRDRHVEVSKWIDKEK